MGIFYNGKLKKIKNHYSSKKYCHGIKINKNSKLYEILKTEKINVNSRHNYCLINSDITVSSKSGLVIESIEDKEKNFFIGVQWHPEDMFSYDYSSKRIFSSFIDACRGD